jgi:hypothetical protein
MKVAKDDIPAKIESPGAVARQQTEFGDATDYGDFAAEHFTLDEDTEFVLFSPQHEHVPVLDHIRSRMEEA